MKWAFLSFEEEAELPQTLKGLRNVVAMFGQAPRVDEDIIGVYQDEAMEVLPEHLVHEVLKYGGGVD